VVVDTFGKNNTKLIMKRLICIIPLLFCFLSLFAQSTEVNWDLTCSFVQDNFHEVFSEWTKSKAIAYMYWYGDKNEKLTWKADTLSTPIGIMDSDVSWVATRKMSTDDGEFIVTPYKTVEPYDVVMYKVKKLSQLMIDSHYCESYHNQYMFLKEKTPFISYKGNDVYRCCLCENSFMVRSDSLINARYICCYFKMSYDNRKNIAAIFDFQKPCESVPFAAYDKPIKNNSIVSKGDEFLLGWQGCMEWNYEWNNIKEQVDGQEKVLQKEAEEKQLASTHDVKWGDKYYKWSELLVMYQQEYNKPRPPKTRTAKKSIVNGIEIEQIDEKEEIDNKPDYDPNIDFDSAVEYDEVSSYSILHEELKIYPYAISGEVISSLHDYHHSSQKEELYKRLEKNNGNFQPPATLDSSIFDISGKFHDALTLLDHKFGCFLLDGQWLVIDKSTGVAYPQIWRFKPISCPESPYLGKKYYLKDWGMNLFDCIGYTAPYGGMSNAHYMFRDANNQLVVFHFVSENLVDFYNAAYMVSENLLKRLKTYAGGKTLIVDGVTLYDWRIQLDNSNLYLVGQSGGEKTMFSLYGAELTSDYSRYISARGSNMIMTKEDFDKGHNMSNAQEIHERKTYIGYDNLVAKYGKRAADAILNEDDIYVGMPEDLAVKYFASKLSIDHGNSKCYDISKYKGGGFFWVTDGRVSSIVNE
jgi:hypothetical protein